jgi:hypothetical protein
MIQGAAPGALLAIDHTLVDQDKAYDVPGKEFVVELDVADRHKPVDGQPAVGQTHFAVAVAAAVVGKSPQELVADSSSYPHFLLVEPVTTEGERSLELKR